MSSSLKIEEKAAPMALTWLPISGDRTIRLFKLLPGNDGDEIVGSFVVTSLDDNPRYESLSYTWGDASITKRITVDGNHFQVTTNLEEALIRLRQPSTTRLIWVDAVCINQQEDVEKTHQVNLMGEIYKNAEQCLIWMGDFRTSGFTELEAELAFEIVKCFASNKHLNEMPFFDGGGISDGHERGFQAWAAIALLPWWRRIWTVQEVTLPAASTVFWGSQSLSFSDFIRAAENLVAHENSCCIDFELTTEVVNSCNHFTAALIGINVMREQRHSMGLLDLLWRFRYRGATDPKDKVFALLGLLDDEDIKSDYAMDTAEVYKKTALTLFRNEGSLISLIGHRGEPLQNPGLPSWVTDWTVPKDTNPTLSRYWDNRERYFWYECDNGIEMEMQVHEGTSAIELGGIFVDRIARVGEPLMQDEDGQTPWWDILKRVKEWRDLAGIEAESESDAETERRRYITGEICSEAFWCTLIGNLILDNSGTREAHPSDVRFVRAFYNQNGQLPNHAGFNNSISDMLINQGLFVSEKGYMGIAPWNVKEGDEIWVLFGSNVPFVLRKLGSEDKDIEVGKGGENAKSPGYIKLGDCYVHGIMQGEAVEGHEHERKAITLY